MINLHEHLSKRFLIAAIFFNVIMFCLEIYTVFYLWSFTNWLTLIGLLWGMSLATEQHVITIGKIRQSLKEIG